jgi:hypothetical protein
VAESRKMAPLATFLPVAGSGVAPSGALGRPPSRAWLSSGSFAAGASGIGGYSTSGTSFDPEHAATSSAPTAMVGALQRLTPLV